MESSAIERIDNTSDQINIDRVMNINVGLLGHVDSGKTALAKGMSTIASTASFDRTAREKISGMTIELGFSAFMVRIPTWFGEKHPDIAHKYDFILFTIVDCPGHATLIRTVLSGASIMDQMILVIDINKGIQVQTAECIVVGELLFCADSIIVALNKMDLHLPDATDVEKEAGLAKKITFFRDKVFAKTIFGKDVPMIPVSAAPRAPGEGDNEGAEVLPPLGMDNLISALLQNLKIPKRYLRKQPSSKVPFICATDHIYQLKGKGRVLTGTILSGKLEVGDTFQIATSKSEHKVKGIQIFHKNVKKAKQGDRVGINFQMSGDQASERDMLFTPDSVPSIRRLLVSVKRVELFKEEIKSKSKFHVTVGNQTVMGNVLAFFSKRVEEEQKKEEEPHEEEKKEKLDLYLGSNDELQNLPTTFDMSAVYMYEQNLRRKKRALEEFGIAQYYAVIELQQSIYIPGQSILIASRLDKVVEKQTRLAFAGRVIKPLNSQETKGLKVVKIKQRRGVVQRVHNDSSLIIKDLFKKETDLSIFLGMTVEIAQLDRKGTIDSTFGKSGKVKVGIDTTAQEQKAVKNAEVVMKFRKFVFNPAAGIFNVK